MFNDSQKVAYLVAAVSAIMATPVHAQQIKSLPEVIVTAQKRSEDANKVPLSVSVMRGHELAEQHIGDLSDLTRAMPNISYSGTNGAGPGLNNIEIRGVSSTAGSGTVGIYLDDVPITTRNLYSVGTPEPKFFDLDRIELLRGPQGTLYGASSMGGTLRFISNQPKLTESESSLHSELSSTRNGGISYRANGVLNTPLIPGELALRVGVQKGHTSGYIDQVSPANGMVVDSGINSQNDSVLRLAMKWAVARNLSITPSIFYQEVKTKDIDTSYLNLPSNQTGKLVREPGTDRMQVPSLTVNYDMGAATLVSVSSYYRRDFDRTQDGTTVNSLTLGNIINNLPGASAGLGDAVSRLPSAVYLNTDVRQFSQEVRIASKPYDPQGAPVTWLGGVFFSKLRTTVHDNEPVFGINDAFAAAGVTPADPNLLGFAFPDDNSYSNVRRTQTKQASVFGELNYYFTPALYATTGMRYLRATESLQRDGDLFFALGPNHSYTKAEFHTVTPKFGLSWKADPNNTLYASASKGFRLGGGNSDIPYSVCADDFRNLNLTGTPASFAPDKLWSYEIGNKSRLLDNRLSINAAAFYIDWTDLQQAIFMPSCGYGFETNLGAAKSYGAEVEVKAKASRNTLLGLSVGYTHAILSTDIPSLGVQKGDRVQGVPRFNAAITGQYNFHLEGETSGFARIAARWIGSSRGSLMRTDPDYLRPAYNIVDLSVGAASDKWEISLFAKNLFNNNKVIQRPPVQFLSQGYRLRPLTVGVSLSLML